MHTNIKKEYEWGLYIRIQTIVVGIFHSIFALGAVGLQVFAGETNLYLLIFMVIFILGTISSFVQYYHMKKNRIFIQVTDDELKKAPNFDQFVFSPKVFKWGDSLKMEIKTFGLKRKIILSKSTGENIKIILNFLNKVDQESLIQDIKAIIEKKPIT